MANRPTDPAFAAANTGRFVTERAQAPSLRKRGRRPAIPRPPSDDDDDHDVDAYSISTFCRRHNISESFYHKLKVQGLGPATLKVGTRVLISKQAARRWR